MKRIFITGASGCIGHYVAEALIQQTDHELFLLVRNPEKLKLNLTARPGIQVVEGNLRQIEKHQALLKTIDVGILLATSWGGAAETYDVNVTKTLELMQYLSAGPCQQILYFSTESILDRQNQLLPQATALGTDYIRTKAIALQKVEQQAQQGKIAPIVALFPTLVFGGDEIKPKSHITSGLPEVLRWLWLARFLKADASFHFVHGADMGQVVYHLVQHPEAVPRLASSGIPKLVLGSAATTVNQAIDQLCAYFGHRILFQIPLSIALAEVIIKVFRIQMAPWDRFCLSYRHFTHANPVSPATFGLPTQAATLPALLQTLGFSPQ
ncbi:MAG: NAD-dependent epimerase/dehydratase family protein [Prochlorothrix sp.]